MSTPTDPRIIDALDKLGDAIDDLAGFASDPRAEQSARNRVSEVWKLVGDLRAEANKLQRNHHEKKP